MKFKLCCFLIVLAHPCLGQNSTEASAIKDAWGSFLKIDRDIPIVTPEKAQSPILRQKVSRTVDAYEKFRSTAFPQLSSPTKWELAPGNYIMWAENPETGQKSSMQEIPVDRNQECDLAVP